MKFRKGEDHPIPEESRRPHAGDKRSASPQLLVVSVLAQAIIFSMAPEAEDAPRPVTVPNGRISAATFRLFGN